MERMVKTVLLAAILTFFGDTAYTERIIGMEADHFPAE